MQKSSINDAFSCLEFFIVCWVEVFVIKGSRFHWARLELWSVLFFTSPQGKDQQLEGDPFKKFSLKRKMRKAGQALSNALHWSQEKAAVSSLSDVCGVFLVLGFCFFFFPFLVAGIWACCHICLSVCLMLFFSESFRGQLPIVSCWEQRLFLVSS